MGYLLSVIIFMYTVIGISEAMKTSSIKAHYATIGSVLICVSGRVRLNVADSYKSIVV